MVSRTTKLRWHRHLRRSQKHVERLGSQAEDRLEQHIVSKLGHLLHIWRFIGVWLALLIILSVSVLWENRNLGQYYQNIQPVAGGIYTEGILGDFTNANPIYASNPVDRAISRLVFSGLFTYNDKNQLVGDLAEGYKVDSIGKNYVVTLKPNLTWQDGQPLTASDVVFTYRAIQNPDAQSPLNSSWQNVTVKALNSRTIQFALTDSLSSFPQSLTNGILPKHLLNGISANQLRNASFNTDPIGSGPFVWKSVIEQGGTPTTRQEQIDLVPFLYYHGGVPKLNGFIIRAYHDKNALISSFQNGGVDGIAGLDSVPSILESDKKLHIYSLPLTAANMVFFKTTSGVLSDTSVRQALVLGANVNQIINGLGYSVVPVREPLLINQVGYNPSYAQISNHPTTAIALLKKDGWEERSDGVLYKKGQPLTFQLYAPNNTDDRYVATQLQKQWQAIGVDVNVIFQSADDLQNTVAFHSYDALLYGISIGVDPDVFVYWESSQANLNAPTHLNFSEYQNSIADQSLEAGRTRSNPKLRTVKYQSFLKEWRTDAPALGLYQPRFLYLTDEPIYGLTEHSINEAANRFNNVQNWAVKLGRVNDN